MPENPVESQRVAVGSHRLATQGISTGGAQNLLNNQPPTHGNDALRTALSLESDDLKAAQVLMATLNSSATSTSPSARPKASPPDSPVVSSESLNSISSKSGKDRTGIQEVLRSLAIFKQIKK